MFRHNQAYLGNIQAYLCIIRTLCNSVIFRNLSLVLIFAPLEKKWQPRGAGAKGIEFGIPWNFVKKQVLHNFTKYFSEA